MNFSFESILKQAESDEITSDEAVFLFKETENFAKAQQLFITAAHVRDSEKGRSFQWSGGIATILPCTLDPLCAYCPYWVKPSTALTIDEILTGVRYLDEHGITNFHLSGGTTLTSDGSDVVSIVEEIRKISKSEITVNVGAGLSLASLVALKDLGVTKVGSSFEVINPKLFSKFKAGDSLEKKKALAQQISDLGFGLGTGMLAGLNIEPSRYQDYADFIFHVKQYENLESVYVSRFFPNKGTPLENHPRCSTTEGARIIAIMRLVLRNIDIGPAAGWSYDDIPVWVNAGGGNRIGGIHISRVPSYKKPWFLHTAVKYENRMEYCNTIPVAGAMLAEVGITDIRY
ncbi:radical SAM protein [Methanospirillum lacunae]|uniref:Radical SAM protein n=1 Tax=Methanospirillum lacunae TaxID=668570 RepID=A0A2V2MZF2_9EURY|nr:radical SAM protein [Methanospirillum lacunae]PWR71715.1 radical SAM protein [Methanospirillum lacunae]